MLTPLWHCEEGFALDSEQSDVVVRGLSAGSSRRSVLGVLTGREASMDGTPCDQSTCLGGTRRTALIRGAALALGGILSATAAVL